MGMGQAGMARVALAALLGNTRLVTLVNGVSSLNSILRLSSSDALSPLLYPLQLFETFVSVFSCVVSVLLESSTSQVLIATEASTTSSRLERAAHGLLSLVCDSVFYLDENLCLEEHSSSLAALLLKTSGSLFKGERFESFVCDNDKARLKNFMTTVSESVPAHCLHLHLLDACGTKISVELFHYHLEGHHIVGIKEETEREHEPQELEVVSWHGKGSHRSENAESASCPSSPRTSVSVIPTEVVEFEDFTLTVDASSSNLNVLRCEPPLPALENVASTQQMLDWVPARKRNKFHVWVKVSMGLVFDGRVAEPMLVHLIPRHLQASQGFLAECVLTGSATTNEMRDSGECIVQIKVHKVQAVSEGGVLDSETSSSSTRRMSL